MAVRLTKKNTGICTHTTTWDSFFDRGNNMRATATLLMTLSLGLFAHAALPCEKPNPISIPDGNKATVEEMNAAGNAFHDYMMAMQNYQGCLDNEANRIRLAADQLSKSQIEEQEYEFTTLHNAASSEMKSTSAEFQRAVDQYKAKLD